MFLKILLLVAYFAHPSRGLTSLADVGGRMYQEGAHDAAQKEYPYMAYIIGDDAVGCSATIPSLSTTLTVARCIVGNKTMVAWAGTNRLRTREDFLHPSQHRHIVKIAVYDPNAIDIHDIGVAWVHDLWVQTDYLRPIPVWVQSTHLPYDFSMSCLVIGFGCGSTKGRDRYLRSMNQTIGASITCPEQSLQLLHQIMCSDDFLERTICRGDNGGAVIIKLPIVRNVQLAIIKGQLLDYEPGPVTADKCDSECMVPANPNLYTFIGFYRNWLLKVIQDWPDFIDRWNPESEEIVPPISQRGSQKLQRFRRNVDSERKSIASSSAATTT